MIGADTHPHIIRNIAAHAPRATLLALRGTNKEMRAYVDALLIPSHLIIAQDPYGRPVASSFEGRIPEFAGWALPDLPNPRFMIARAFDPRFTSKVVHTSILAPVRVVDLEGAASLSLLGNFLQSPITLRTKRNVLHRTEPLTQKPFAAAQDSVRVLLEPLTALFAPNFRPLWHVGVLDRAVVNIWSHPLDRLRRAHPRLRMGRDRLSRIVETVWVFHAESGPCLLPPGAGRSAGAATGRGDMLSMVAKEIVDQLMLNVKTTVVNVATLAEGMDDEEALDWIEPEVTFRDICASAYAFGRVDASSEQRKEALDRIRFMTLDEYRTEVGDERADVETTWSGRG